MKLAVLDYCNNTVDILNLSEEATKIFNETIDTAGIIEDLGYDVGYCSWMSGDFLLKEYNTKIKEGKITIDD